MFKFKILFIKLPTDVKNKIYSLVFVLKISYKSLHVGYRVSKVLTSAKNGSRVNPSLHFNNIIPCDNGRLHIAHCRLE